MHTPLSHDDLLRRAFGEYLEMPGLRLNCSQARRLWGLDEGTCARLLNELVELKFLVCRGAGWYTRRDAEESCLSARNADRLQHAR